MSESTARSSAQTAPACPVCGTTLAKRLYPVGEYAMWRCGTCRTMSIFPRPDEPPADLYDEAYFRGGHEGFGYSDYEDDRYAAGVYAQVRDRLIAAYPDRGRLLDIGCAEGGFVEAATQDGWAATGVDPGAFAVEQGRAKGLDLRANTIRGARFPDDEFDVVATLHTVEHLPDPVADLREARRIIKDDGYLVVEVPNARSVGYLIRRDRWAQIKPPEHINFFDRRSLAGLLRRTGFRPIGSETTGIPEVTVAAASRGGPFGLAATAAKRLGVLRAVDRFGFGGYLRMFARPA